MDKKPKVKPLNLTGLTSARDKLGRTRTPGSNEDELTEEEEKDYEKSQAEREMEADSGAAHLRSTH